MYFLGIANEKPRPYQKKSFISMNPARMTRMPTNVPTMVAKPRPMRICWNQINPKPERMYTRKTTPI